MGHSRRLVQLLLLSIYRLQIQWWPAVSTNREEKRETFSFVSKSIYSQLYKIDKERELMSARHTSRNLVSYAQSTSTVVFGRATDFTWTQQRPESSTLTLTWQASKHRVHKFHQRYNTQFAYYVRTIVGDSGFISSCDVCRALINSLCLLFYTSTLALFCVRF